MSTNSPNPFQGCSRLAAGVWHYAPCGVVVRKAVWPGVRSTFTQLSEMIGALQPVSPGILPTQKRPLRQRMCRFVFREFLRSCGIGARSLRLEALKPWQIALGSSGLGALLMWIVA